MKKVKVQDAIGMTLCHDITAMVDGFKGAAFKRGHVITQEDIPKLLDIGKQHVFIWEENAGEIHEEDAARRLSQMTTVDGAHYGSISEAVRRSGRHVPRQQSAACICQSHRRYHDHDAAGSLSGESW